MEYNFNNPFPRSEGWHQVAFRVGRGEAPYTEEEVKAILSTGHLNRYEWGEFKEFKTRCRIYYRLKPIP